MGACSSPKTFAGFRLGGTCLPQGNTLHQKRGVKYNLPLDLRLPTYFGPRFKPLPIPSRRRAKEAIPDVWDMDYWKEWFDEMARKPLQRHLDLEIATPSPASLIWMNP